MSIPKLDVPTFETIVPSTKKRVKYRPFLVKEHKVLLMMKDSGTDEIIRIVKELVDTCTFNSLKIEDLTCFDIDYLFLQIRIKSLGETVAVIFDCAVCSEKLSGQLDLTKASVTNAEHKTTIDLTATSDGQKVGIEMMYPKFDDVVHLFDDPTEERSIKTIVNGIKAIYTDQDYHTVQPEEREELYNFVMSLFDDDLNRIADFYRKMPRVHNELTVECPVCNHQNTRTVQGIENFFV